MMDAHKIKRIVLLMTAIWHARNSLQEQFLQPITSDLKPVTPPRLIVKF